MYLPHLRLPATENNYHFSHYCVTTFFVFFVILPSNVDYKHFCTKQETLPNVKTPLVYDALMDFLFDITAFISCWNKT